MWLLQSLDYHFRYSMKMGCNSMLKGKNTILHLFPGFNLQQCTKCQQGLCDKKTHDMQEYV